MTDTKQKNVATEAERLAYEGHELEAVTTLQAAAAREDPDALFLLADWHIYGLYVARDSARAEEYLRRAAELGHVTAARIRAHMLANGGFGREPDLEGAVEILKSIAPRDPHAEIQLLALSKAPDAAALRNAPREQLCADPRIELVRGLVLPQECEYLMAVTEHLLQPSMVADPVTGAPVPSEVRRSFAASILITQEDLVINMINRRLADVTGTNMACGEPLNILRYDPGQEYRPHHDALPNEPNQRVWTALLYLNRDYEGGQTHFPLLGITGRGDVGDVLIFRNALEDGSLDERSYHAGLPVQAGTKWLASRWIRQAPFVPE